MRWLVLTLPLAWLMAGGGAYAIVQANFIANIAACLLGVLWLKMVYSK
jgi:hypothetical protein